MTPTYSVIVPLFDKRDHIAATLRSVLAQTLAPIEVIVVDDGSTDGSADVVAALGDPRIRIVAQANAGPGAARNRGVAEARGEWVALIDGDDLWLPTHLATLAAIAAAVPQADMVATAIRRVGAGAVATDAAPILPPRAIDIFAVDDAFQTSAVAIRRAAFRTTSGFGNYRLGEDLEFWLRFALDHVIGFSDTVTTSYRRDVGGLMEQAQAAMARGDPVPESPIFATLAGALADPRYGERHDAIRAYADRTRVAYARSLIYNGQGKAARALLAGVMRPGRAALAWRVAAWVPGRAMWRAARWYSALKRN